MNSARFATGLPSEVKKKSSRGRIIDWPRKCIRPVSVSPQKRHNEITPEKVSQSGPVSQSLPPNRQQVSRCKTCAERPHSQSDSCPEESNYESRIKSSKTSPPRVKLTDQFLLAKRKNSREILSPITWPTDGKRQSHPLPLPPLTISNPSPFSSSSARTSPNTQFGSPTSPAWKKGRLLGRGTFGQVYIGFNSETGEMCAMKEVVLFSDDAKSKESAKQLQQEIAFLSRLHHPNIVQYYGSATLDDKLYIYLEYVSGGSIHKILQEYGQLGEAAIRSYTQQILSGLAYLHAKNTLHRDIKGANILVDPSGRVKLVDFGMAKHITGQSCPLSLKGSPYWMAPEVIKNSSSCNFAVDIWSLGCTVLEMATAKPPWSQYEGVAAMFKIGYSKELPAIPDHLSDEGKDFVVRCLQWNPFKRPTAVQLLEHPFVKSSASLERPEELFSFRDMGFGHLDSPLCLDSSPRVANHSRNLKASPQFSDAYTMRTISCPVSPTEFPLSPSPMWSPQAKSDFSTPSGRGNGTLLIHHQKQPNNYLHKGVGFQNTVHQNSNDYPEQKPDMFRGIGKAHLETVPHKSDLLGNKAERPVSNDQKEQPYNPHLTLADRVSKQLLINPLRLNPVLELNPNPSVLSRDNRI